MSDENVNISPEDTKLAKIIFYVYLSIAILLASGVTVFVVYTLLPVESAQLDDEYIDARRKHVKELEIDEVGYIDPTWLHLDRKKKLWISNYAHALKEADGFHHIKIKKAKLGYVIFINSKFPKMVMAEFSGVNNLSPVTQIEKE